MPSTTGSRHLPDAVNGPSAVVEALLHGNGPGRRSADSGGEERFRECRRRANLKGQLHAVAIEPFIIVISWDKSTWAWESED